MIKILLSGCNGKMGQEVIKAIDENDDLMLLAGFDRQNLGECTYPIYTDITEIQEKPDVIVDFSVPMATLNILEYAKQANIPVVIATTGFNNEQLDKISEYSKHIPIFKSSNMSYDINLMAKLLADLALKLKGADIEIIETHHNRKIDNPSGTAILLADSINNALGGNMKYEFNRFDKHEKRDKNEIGFSSIRGGNIVGEHIVQFYGEYETFEIKHTCYSRTVFAEGALKAARYIINQKSGLYDMNYLLKN